MTSQIASGQVLGLGSERRPYGNEQIFEESVRKSHQELAPGHATDSAKIRTVGHLDSSHNAHSSGITVPPIDPTNSPLTSSADAELLPTHDTSFLDLVGTEQSQWEYVEMVRGEILEIPMLRSFVEEEWTSQVSHVKETDL